MSWIDDINKELEKNRESLRKKGYDVKKLRKSESARAGGFAIKSIDPTLSELRKHIDFESEHMQEVMHNNGKTQGDINKDNGHMNKIQKIGCSIGGTISCQMEHMEGARKKSGDVSSAIEYVCPHCKYEGNGPTMFKSHFDRCIGYIDVFEFNGEVGQLVRTYNNRKDILKDFPSIKETAMVDAIKGQKKRKHPHYVGGYLVIPRGINNK
jgi:hypothetical protein